MGGVVADPGLYGAYGPALPDTSGDFYFLTFNNGENAGPPAPVRRTLWLTS